MLTLNCKQRIVVTTSCSGSKIVVVGTFLRRIFCSIPGSADLTLVWSILRGCGVDVAVASTEYTCQVWIAKVSKAIQIHLHSSAVPVQVPVSGLRMAQASAKKHIATGPDGSDEEEVAMPIISWLVPRKTVE